MKMVTRVYPNDRISDSIMSKKEIAKTAASSAALVGALCAALTVFPLAAAEAGEVRINDFVFGCETPDGEALKPQFGDMEG